MACPARANGPTSSTCVHSVAIPLPGVAEQAGSLATEQHDSLSAGVVGHRMVDRGPPARCRRPASILPLRTPTCRRARRSRRHHRTAADADVSPRRQGRHRAGARGPCQRPASTDCHPTPTYRRAACPLGHHRTRLPAARRCRTRRHDPPGAAARCPASWVQKIGDMCIPPRSRAQRHCPRLRNRRPRRGPPGA